MWITEAENKKQQQVVAVGTSKVMDKENSFQSKPGSQKQQ